MKTLFPLLLIIALIGACNTTPDEMKFTGRNYTATMTMNTSIPPSMTPTQIPSQTPAPTISVTATSSRAPLPSPTLPTDCGTPKFGKPGTQKLNDWNAPNVLIQGKVILCTNNVIFTGDEVFPIDPQAMFDLDAGKAAPDGADVVFDVFGRMNFYSVSTFNDAVSQSWSLQVEGLEVKYPPQPTYDQCKEQVADPGQWDNEPAYLCVITNDGHVSRVKVEKFNPIDWVQSMEISFVTWNEVGQP